MLNLFGWVCSFLLLAQKKRTKEKGTPIALSSPKVSGFSGLRELATLKQRAALIRKITDFRSALSGVVGSNPKIQLLSNVGMLDLTLEPFCLEVGSTIAHSGEVVYLAG